MSDLDNLARLIVEQAKEGIDSIEKEAMSIANEKAEQCLNAIVDDSPEDSGEYKSGWKKRKTKAGYVISNTTRPEISMPLEFGHIGENGERKGARPHIFNNYYKYLDEFQDECVKRIGGRS